MAEPQTLPAATIAKLLNVPEARLEQLVRSGAIPKAERGRYQLLGSVQGYIRHLQSRVGADGAPVLDEPFAQGGVAKIVGITAASMSVNAKLGIFEGASTNRDGVLRYCARLRASAARQEGGLSDERAKLAAAQRERVEMENAVRRAELAPVTTLRETLAAVAAACVAHIDAVVPKARQRLPHLSARDLATIDALLKEARNAMAEVGPSSGPKRVRRRRAAV